jgi:histidyl-tRNA synthetase
MLRALTLRSALRVPFVRMFAQGTVEGVRGTHDYDAEHLRLRSFVVSKAYQIAEASGFAAFETPIMESAQLYLRSIESSDIVLKEVR